MAKEMDRALTIYAPWLLELLEGKRCFDLRKKQTKQPTRVALTCAGSNLIFGAATICKVEAMSKQALKELWSQKEWDVSEVEAYLGASDAGYLWYFEEPKVLVKPQMLVRRRGQVNWLSVTKEDAASMETLLTSPEGAPDTMASLRALAEKASRSPRSAHSKQLPVKAKASKATKEGGVSKERKPKESSEKIRQGRRQLKAPPKMRPGKAQAFVESAKTGEEDQTPTMPLDVVVPEDQQPVSNKIEEPPVPKEAVRGVNEPTRGGGKEYKGQQGVIEEAQVDGGLQSLEQGGAAVPCTGASAAVVSPQRDLSPQQQTPAASAESESKKASAKAKRKASGTAEASGEGGAETGKASKRASKKPQMSRPQAPQMVTALKTAQSDELAAASLLPKDGTSGVPLEATSVSCSLSSS